MSLFKLEDIQSSEPKTRSKKELAKDLKKKTLLTKAQESLKIIDISHNDVLHCVSMGDWSTHNLVSHILDKTGPAHVYAATWSITEDPVRYVLSMLNSGKIESMSMIIDWRCKVRCPETLQLAKATMSNIACASCHAKVTVIQNDSWNISIVGSSNYTNNPRIEAMTITESMNVANFHKGWITDIINKADPFESERKRK